MLTVLLYPALYLSVMPIYALFRSLMLSPTLQRLALLHTARASLCLSVSLLQDLGSMTLHNTKICPNSTEELILNAKPWINTYEARIPYNLYFHTPPPRHIRHLNYSTKNCYHLEQS